MKKILLGAFILCAALATSCQRDTTKPEVDTEGDARKQFLQEFKKAEAGVYCGAGKSYMVDVENDQITYTEDQSVYMVSDMEYTKSYTLNIEGELKVGSSVDVEYTSAGYDGLSESATVSMKVLKSNGSEQYVWLWDTKNLKGFVLHFEPIEE